MGDLIVLREDNNLLFNWPLGRIIKLYPGQNEIIRVVNIRTANGVVKRAVKNSPFYICLIIIFEIQWGRRVFRTHFNFYVWRSWRSGATVSDRDVVELELLALMCFFLLFLLWLERNTSYI